MNLFLLLFSLVIAAYALSGLLRLIKVPGIVGLMAVGFLTASPWVQHLIPENHLTVIFGLGDAGLIALLFLAGLEVSPKLLSKELKEASSVAIFGALVPFLLGFFLIKFLGYPLPMALVVGACMSITAEGTTDRLLFELKKLKSRLGSLLIDVGLIDNIFGMILFVSITFLTQESYAKENILISFSILSFFVGILLQHNLGRHHTVLKVIEKTLLWFLVPFLFIAMGLHFNAGILISDPKIVLLILLVGSLGKLGGAFLAKPFTALSWSQLHLVGWGMNSRGALELGLALIAFRTHLLSEALYSALVLMALVTTFVFPFVIRYTLYKNPSIMD